MSEIEGGIAGRVLHMVSEEVEMCQDILPDTGCSVNNFTFTSPITWKSDKNKIPPGCWSVRIYFGTYIQPITKPSEMM